HTVHPCVLVIQDFLNGRCASERPVSVVHERDVEMGVRDNDVAIHRGLVREIIRVKLPHALLEETLAVSPCRISAAVVEAEMLQVERCASNSRSRCLRHNSLLSVDVGAHPEPLASLLHVRANMANFNFLGPLRIVRVPCVAVPNDSTPEN